MSIAAHHWLFTAPGAPLQRVEFSADAGPGEVVVAVAGCGVCHTDLGYYYDGVRTTEWKIFECSGTPAGQISAFNLLVP